MSDNNLYFYYEDPLTHKTKKMILTEDGKFSYGNPIDDAPNDLRALAVIYKTNAELFNLSTRCPFSNWAELIADAEDNDRVSTLYQAMRNKFSSTAMSLSTIH